VVIATALVAIELNNFFAPPGATSSATSVTLSTSTTDLSSTNYQTPTSLSSGVSPDGLELMLTLNSSSVRSHGAISAQIEVVNTLNRNVSAGKIPDSHQTAGIFNKLDMEDLNYYDFTCGTNPTYFLSDFALLKGHYTAGNVSSAGGPLQLKTTFIPPCPGFFVGETAVTFLPNGDQAVATFYGLNQPPVLVTVALNATTFYCVPKAGLEPPGNCGAGDGLVGYWNQTIIAQGALDFNSPAFAYFPPGEYTIVAFDAWNQYVYATFTVSS
jgi:hypothetical protein